MRRRTMYLRMVTSSVTRRRSRVVIALLAVAIGAATLSGLATIAIDIPRQMGRELRSYGANLLVLPADDADRLSTDVLPEIAALLTTGDVVGVAPYRYETVRINAQPFLAAGTDLEQVQAVSPYWYVEGRWPEAPGEVLVGQDVAEWIGLVPGDAVALTGVDTVGQDVEREVTVAGLLSTGGSEDALVFMALAGLEDLTGVSGEVDVVEYSVAATAEEIDALATEISAQVAGATAGPVTRLTQSDTSVLDTLRSLLALVTVIVLALTMIGVSTTMMAIVTERRTEIGLRKALGADDRGIMAEFLGEGLLVGAVGGLLGAVLGLGLAELISVNVFHRGITLQPALAVVTVLASVVVAGVACLVPVRRAMDVDPAVVLRGE